MLNRRTLSCGRRNFMHMRRQMPKMEERGELNLVTVPLDLLPESCTFTMLPEISARRSLPA